MDYDSILKQAFAQQRKIQSENETSETPALKQIGDNTKMINIQLDTSPGGGSIYYLDSHLVKHLYPNKDIYDFWVKRRGNINKYRIGKDEFNKYKTGPNMKIMTFETQEERILKGARISGISAGLHFFLNDDLSNEDLILMVGSAIGEELFIEVGEKNEMNWGDIEDIPGVVFKTLNDFNIILFDIFDKFGLGHIGGALANGVNKALILTSLQYIREFGGQLPRKENIYWYMKKLEHNTMYYGLSTLLISGGVEDFNNILAQVLTFLNKPLMASKSKIDYTLNTGVTGFIHNLTLLFFTLFSAFNAFNITYGWDIFKDVGQLIDFVSTPGNWISGYFIFELIQKIILNNI